MAFKNRYKISLSVKISFVQMLVLPAYLISFSYGMCALFYSAQKSKCVCVCVCEFTSEKIETVLMEIFSSHMFVMFVLIHARCPCVCITRATPVTAQSLGRV